MKYLPSTQTWHYLGLQFYTLADAVKFFRAWRLICLYGGTDKLRIALQQNGYAIDFRGRLYK